MRAWLQHKLCPLHIYCALRDLRVPRDMAIKLANKWTPIYRAMGL